MHNLFHLIQVCLLFYLTFQKLADICRYFCYRKIKPAFSVWNHEENNFLITLSVMFWNVGPSLLEVLSIIISFHLKFTKYFSFIFNYVFFWLFFFSWCMCFYFFVCFSISFLYLVFFCKRYFFIISFSLKFIDIYIKYMSWWQYKLSGSWWRYRRHFLIKRFFRSH